jgi:AraC-like DNA-binding protein
MIYKNYRFHKFTRADPQPLSFYQQQILKIKEDHFPKDYLYSRIIRAKLFIDNFYYDPIDLNAMAEEAHFSKFHFIRLFKITYGKTPHQYLIHVRIEKAKLLLQSPAPVSTICFWVGFHSISSFTGLFKKMAGFTPSAFQDRQKKLKTVAAKTPVQWLPWYFTEKSSMQKNRQYLSFK